MIVLNNNCWLYLMFAMLNVQYLYSSIWISTFVHKFSLYSSIWISTFVHKFSLTSLTLTSFKAQESSRKMKYSGENGRKPSSICKNTRKILACTKNKEKIQFSFIYGKCKNLNDRLFQAIWTSILTASGICLVYLEWDLLSELK